MAAFKAKQIKIKLQCDRAEKEDIHREELADQGLPIPEIDRIIQNSRMEKYRPTTTNPDPWEESGKVFSGLHATNFGLIGTHKVKTTTQDLYAPVQKKFDKYQTRKFTGRGEVFGETANEILRAQTSEVDTTRKTKKLLDQKEQDKAIKQQNFRDHLTEMYKGMDSLNQMPKTSHAHEQFEFNKHMQSLCDNVNFEHHMMKNDLKWFSEAYIKYRNTMRK